MVNLMNFFTRRYFLVGSVIMVVVYIVSYFNRTLNLPSFYRDFCCVDDRKLNLFLIFIPVFIFSVISFKLDELTFKKLERFTFIYVFFYILLYLMSPTQGDGYLWFQRESISLFGSIVYSVISFILIFYKSLNKEQEE